LANHDRFFGHYAIGLRVCQPRRQAPLAGEHTATADQAGSTTRRHSARIGWHTFRHSSSSLLRRVGADIKVQQELLRHSTIQSTMNVYTKAMPEGKRAANSVVVRSVLPSEACCGISRKLEWEPIATGELVSGCWGWICSPVDYSFHVTC
jgi:integrase